MSLSSTFTPGGQCLPSSNIKGSYYIASVPDIYTQYQGNSCSDEVEMFHPTNERQVDESTVIRCFDTGQYVNIYHNNAKIQKAININGCDTGVCPVCENTKEWMCETDQSKMQT